MKYDDYKQDKVDEMKIVMIVKQNVILLSRELWIVFKTTNVFITKNELMWRWEKLQILQTRTSDKSECEEDTCIACWSGFTIINDIFIRSQELKEISVWSELKFSISLWSQRTNVHIMNIHIIEVTVDWNTQRVVAFIIFLQIIQK